MADIMYDYNKTRLMYGLRKLAQNQTKKEEKEQAAPAPAASEKPSIAIEPSPTLTTAPSEKPAPAPNYSFTQQQRAAARKRRALITAVAGTVGFGTGYLANQLISDDPTLTGGLLTGGVVGALAGGAGYALSDPQTYLKAKADAEFKKNNPDAAEDKNKGDRSWGERLDDLVDWIGQNPWPAAGSGLGIAALLGTMRQFGRRGLAAIPETAQKFKDLFSRNKGNDASAATAPQSAAQKQKKIDIAADKLNKQRQRKFWMSRKVRQIDQVAKGLSQPRGSDEYQKAKLTYDAMDPARQKVVKSILQQATEKAKAQAQSAPAAAPATNKTSAPAPESTTGASKGQLVDKKQVPLLTEAQESTRLRALKKVIDGVDTSRMSRRQAGAAHYKAARDAGFSEDQIRAYVRKMNEQIRKQNAQVYKRLDGIFATRTDRAAVIKGIKEARAAKFTDEQITNYLRRSGKAALVKSKKVNHKSPILNVQPPPTPSAVKKYRR